MIAHPNALGTTTVGFANRVQTGGIVEVAAGTSFFGTMSVDDGGRLIVNGTYSFGAGGNTFFSAGTGATVGGAGTFGGSNRPVFSQGATIAPGENSAATLTFTAGLQLTDTTTIDAEIGTAIDQIRVSGGQFSGPAGASGKIILWVRDGGGAQMDQPYVLLNLDRRNAGRHRTGRLRSPSQLDARHVRDPGDDAGLHSGPRAGGAAGGRDD